MKIRMDFRDVPFTANNRRMMRYAYKNLRRGGMKRKTARKEMEIVYMICLRAIAWRGAEADPNSEHYVAPKKYRDPFCYGEGPCTNPEHVGLHEGLR